MGKYINIIFITYEEFLQIKNNRYSTDSIKRIAIKYLDCKIEDIDDVDFNYTRSIDIYTKIPVEERRNLNELLGNF